MTTLPSLREVQQRGSPGASARQALQHVPGLDQVLVDPHLGGAVGPQGVGVRIFSTGRCGVGHNTRAASACLCKTQGVVGVGLDHQGVLWAVRSQRCRPDIAWGFKAQTKQG